MHVLNLTKSMYVRSESREFNDKDLVETTHALRDALICLGWVKTCSVFCYIAIYILVNIYSKGTWSEVLKIMIGFVIPLELVNGLLLFLGALEMKPVALKIAAILCLFVAVLNTAIGLVGALYFFRIATQAMHILLAILFGLIALCCCSVLCHDVIVINMFVKLIENPPQSQQNPPRTLEIQTNRIDRETP